MTSLIYFIPNLFLTLIITFYLSYLVVELTVKLFRIKQPLWLYLFRLIPFFKIPLDFFLFKFSNWTLTNHIPLLSQPENAKTLSANLSLSAIPSYNLYFHMTDQCYGFGIFDMLAEKIGYAATLIITSILVLHSLIRLFIWVKKLIQEIQFKETSLIPFELQKLRPSLQKEIHKKGAGVFITDGGHFSPYVKLGRSPKIILPAQIEKILTEEEVEATISHELAHLHPLAHITAPFVSLIKALFFFVSVNSVQQSLEKWCDSSIHKFQIKKEALAYSIQKVAQNITPGNRSYYPTFVKSSTPFARIASILTLSPKISILKALFLSLILIYISTFLLTGQIGHF